MYVNSYNILWAAKKKNVIFFLVVLLLVTCCNYSYSQSFHHELDMNFVEARSGDVIPLNAYATIETLETPLIVSIKVDNPLQLVSKLRDTISGTGKLSKYIPVKVFVPKYIKSDTTYKIIVTYEHIATSSRYTDTCIVSIVRVKKAHMFVIQQTASLNRSMDSLIVPLRVVNAGNIDQKLTIVARLPELAGSDYFKILNKRIPAYSDTLIYFKRKATSAMFRRKSFEVTFTGLFEDGNVFGNSITTIQVSSSSRSYLEQQPLYKETDGTPNMMAMAARYIGTPFENYQLLGGSSLQFKNSIIRYNADVTMWKNGNIRPLVRNTFIDIEKKGLGVRLGSTQINSELNLNGKGGVVYKENPETHSYVEAGYMVSGYNLISYEQIGDLNKGRSAWVNLKKHNRSFHSNTMMIYERAPFSYTETAIANTELSWDNKAGSISITGGAGYSRDTRKADDDKPGFAGGVMYTRSFGEIYLHSANYISTSYFPGYRRGAITLDQRLSRSFKNKTIWLSGSYYDFAPGYLPGTIAGFKSEYKNMRISAGTDVGGKGYFSFAANITAAREENNNSILLGISNRKSRLESLRGKLAIHYSNSIRQCFVMLSSENGIYSTTLYPGRELQSKNMVTFRYRFFTVSAMYQYGYYYLTEVMNSIRYNQSDYSLLTLSPMIEHAFLRDKLKLMAGGTYSSNALFGESIMINFRIGYKLSGKVTAHTGMDYNKYSFAGVTNTLRNYEVGISREMPPAQVNLFTGSDLIISVYYDMNSNGIIDDSDQPAKGKNVDINGILMVTDNKGRATLKHTPDTTFEIKVAPSREWYAPVQVVEVDGKTDVDVLLQKSGKISGNVNYLYDKYSYEVIKRMHGVTIEARGENNDLYTARTDEHGRFLLYLPQGDFILSVKNLLNEIECVNDNMAVSTTAASPVDVEFLLKVKTRKLDVKKFSNYSMK